MCTNRADSSDCRDNEKFNYCPYHLKRTNNNGDDGENNRILSVYALVAPVGGATLMPGQKRRPHVFMC